MKWTHPSLARITEKEFCHASMLLAGIQIKQTRHRSPVNVL